MATNSSVPVLGLRRSYQSSPYCTTPV